jgi:hypothetical protein
MSTDHWLFYACEVMLVFCTVVKFCKVVSIAAQQQWLGCSAAVISPCCRHRRSDQLLGQYTTSGLLTSTGMLLLPSQKGLQDHQTRLFRKQACFQRGFSTPSTLTGWATLEARQAGHLLPCRGADHVSHSLCLSIVCFVASNEHAHRAAVDSVLSRLPVAACTPTSPCHDVLILEKIELLDQT